jgi:hypothetical protein
VQGVLQPGPVLAEALDGLGEAPEKRPGLPVDPLQFVDEVPLIGRQRA